jgi:hypothetical protein
MWFFAYSFEKPQDGWYIESTSYLLHAVLISIVLSYLDTVVPTLLAVKHADFKQNTETMNVHA